MKLELFNAETNKLWKRMSSESVTEGLDIELELYKKLLNFFQVGEYYYYIFNIAELKFDLVSSTVKEVIGIKPEQFTVPLVMDCIHPEDRPWFLAFETRTAEFLSALPMEKLTKYKVRYDFRFKKADGEYIRLLHQVAVIQHDIDGKLMRTLGVHTDITHLKPEGLPVMSVIGMDGEPSYLNIDIKNPLITSKEILSKREKQVLRLLIEGNSSKEISDLLSISKQTVETHRKNMLQKTELKSTSELVAKSIRQGWV